MGESLKEFGFTHDQESVELLFKMVGTYQFDTKKYKSFFERTKAHFIHRNQVLFYDRSKRLRAGDQIDTTASVYDLEQK